MSKTISITGLGWLGKPLYNRLNTLGFNVKGSVSSNQKAAQFQQKRIEAYKLLITEQGVEGEVRAVLEDVDILIIMIPPGLRHNSGADFVKKMTHYRTAIEKAGVSKVILISSTSVYGDAQGNVTEKDSPQPEAENGRQLLQVEQDFFRAEAFQTSVVRFGGLVGGSRQPVRFLAGRTDLANGEAPVNLIHREDCLNILTAIIMKDAFGHIFNAVHPLHPTKEDYYTEKARELSLEPPQYRSERSDQKFKEVNSVQLTEILGYTFQQKP
ncbi:NAD(P)H-binding protein [Flavobacteriaceae bacterium TK19130]|nr:NAD(P)H-binding protein [Thermobacterium salinum]